MTDQRRWIHVGGGIHDHTAEPSAMQTGLGPALCTCGLPIIEVSSAPIHTLRSAAGLGPPPETSEASETVRLIEAFARSDRDLAETVQTLRQAHRMCPTRLADTGYHDFGPTCPVVALWMTVRQR